MQPRTPFPWPPVLASCAIWIITAHFCCVQQPYTPWMVHSFFPNENIETIGFHSGYVSSAPQLGQLATAFLWGYLSDKWGRRPVLILSLLLSTAAFVWFGFSFNMTTAVVSNFVFGAANGAVGVVKTSFAEVCGDEHQARGWGILGTSNAIIRLAAPTLGGFLANQHAIAAFPYALPSLVFGGCGALVLLAVWLFPDLLPETLKKAEAAVSADARHEEETTGLLSVVESDSDEQVSGELSAKGEAASRETEETRCPCLLAREPMLACSLYALLGLGDSIVRTTQPLWLLSSQAHHGFALQSDQIGMLIASPAPVEILFQAFAFPRLCERYGTLHVFRVGVLASAVAAFTIPFASRFNTASESTQTVVLVAQQTAILVSLVSCYAAVFGLINNSAPQHARGGVNGMAQTIVGLTRTLGPWTAGNMYAWSVQYSALGFHVCFVVGSAVLLVCFGVSLLLDERINVQKQ